MLNDSLIKAIMNSPPWMGDADGYYGTPPSQQVRDNAIAFLSSLPKYYREVIDPVDCITPMAHGTIVIDWYLRKQFVSVEIGNTLVGFFTDFDDGINPQSNGLPAAEIRDVVVQCLNKLYRRTDK